MWIVDNTRMEGDGREHGDDNTHVSNRLNGVYVIHLSCYQLPNRRLNLRICLRHITSINEIPPRLRQSIKRIHRFIWVFGVDVGRLWFWNAILHVLIEKLAKLILVGVLERTRVEKVSSRRRSKRTKFTFTPKSWSDQRCFVCFAVVVVVAASPLSSVETEENSRLVVDR